MKVSAKNFHDGQLKERKRQKILTRLRKDQKVKNVQLILRIGDDRNLLHIVTPKEADRLIARKKPLVLVGIAKDMDGAYKVIKEIAEYITNAHESITGDLIDKELDITWS